MKLTAAMAIVAALAGPALAQDRAGYVDEVAVFGGPSAEDAREHVRAAFVRAGLDARFAGAEVQPCGEVADCLAQRARAANASVALRVTVVEVAGELETSILVVKASGEIVAQQEVHGDLSVLEGVLAGLVEPAPTPRARHGWLRWGLVGGAIAFGLAGGVATWRSQDLEDGFFRDHVGADGNVFGISPEDARDAEARAQHWALAGGLLFAAAGGSAIGATVLFLGERHDEPARPVGVALVGRF